MIGIISDTHDNVDNIKKAMKVFKENNVDFVIHCGDIIAVKTVEFFEGASVKFVRGNCDAQPDHVAERAKEFGHEYLGETAEIEYKGKLIGVTHGDDESQLQGMINSKKYDYILTGHTHQSLDQTIGKTRILNPGAHYWGGENKIILLDVEKNIAEFVEL